MFMLGLCVEFATYDINAKEGHPVVKDYTEAKTLSPFWVPYSCHKKDGLRVSKSIVYKKNYCIEQTIIYVNHKLRGLIKINSF